MAEIRNPQSEPGGERKLLIVFALTFLMIIIGQAVFFKNVPKKPQDNKQSQPAAATTAPAAIPTASAAPATPAIAAPVKQAQGETETVVENNLYRIVFTNRGAQVKSWVLKKYNDDSGKPLELVHQQAAQQFGYPLSFFTYDPALTSKLNSGLYVASATGNLTAPNELTFEYSDGDVSAKKTIRFADNYVIGLETNVTRGGATVTALPAWPCGFGDDVLPVNFAMQGVVKENAGDTERTSEKKVVGGATVNGPFNWAGPQDQYFAALFLPESPQSATMVTLHHQLRIPENLDHPDPNKTTAVDIIGAAVGYANAPVVERLFVGPKAVGVLQTVHSNTAPGQFNGPDLAHVVDFGKWLGFIAKPLFLWLRWTHDHWVPTFNGWGWAIIILTVLINLALMPLRLMTMKSALKMQKIQPQMKAIQEKYKAMKMTDPRRAEQNKELSALYAQHGVNPAGGCLPMLLQMPFLFAFYGMLAVAIELRHAHWFWLTDLSAPDHRYVIPVLILISTYLMQKLTPNAGMDPAQARMMMFMMPVMLFFFSLRYASGLGLYWIVGNVIGFGQQMLINQSELGREMTALRAKQAQKRALKGKK